MFSHQKLNDFVLNHKTAGWYGIIGLTVVLLISSIHNGAVSVGSNELGNNTVLFYVNGLIGTATTLSFCIYISSLKVKTNIGIKMMSFLKWFGQNSFYVMATHFPVKELFIRLIGSVFHCGRSGVIGNMKYSFMAFVLTLLADTIVVMLICLIKKKDEQIKLSK